MGNPMALVTQPSHLLNPLATSQQLETSASQLDGVPKDLEDSVRFETARLVQAAGILLRLPQEIIGQAIVILFRFWTSPDGGSLLEHDAKDVAAASLYLTAKPSAHPISPRQVLTTIEYLAHLTIAQLLSTSVESKLDVQWTFSEGQYELGRDRLYGIEFHILRALGFQTHVALPYTICTNYLQTLDVFQNDRGTVLAQRAFAHLNGALLSPQLLYLTHPPSTIATAAIYLAAREVKFKLPEVEWWEVFDVDREELGFVVVALQSLEGYAWQQKKRYDDCIFPFTVTALEVLLRQERLSEGDV